MRVLVCGGRNFDDIDMLYNVMDYFDGDERIIDMVIHGGARGADTLAGNWTRFRGREEVVCPANWDSLGRRAGIVRNNTMLKLKPDLVIAFPGGKGTASMIGLAKAAGIEVHEV